MATYYVDWDSAWESSDEAQKIIVHHLKEEICKQVAPFIEIDTVQDVPNMNIVYRARLRVVNSKGY